VSLFTDYIPTIRPTITSYTRNVEIIWYAFAKLTVSTVSQPHLHIVVSSCSPIHKPSDVEHSLVVRFRGEKSETHQNKT
jgi:hypothetical protein